MQYGSVLIQFKGLFKQEICMAGYIRNQYVVGWGCFVVLVCEHPA